MMPLVLAALLALAAPAIAGERVDLYDTKGQRTGYAVVTPETGRVDLYDAKSRRTGYGTVSPSGRLTLYGMDGRRVGTTGPVPPGPARPR